MAAATIPAAPPAPALALGTQGGTLGPTATRYGGTDPVLFPQNQIWDEGWLLLPLHHCLKQRAGPAAASRGSTAGARAPRHLLERNILGIRAQSPRNLTQIFKEQQVGTWKCLELIHFTT